MDLNKQSPPLDNTTTKAEFRKPSAEAASRKYRRRSPVSGSSSSDGSPDHVKADAAKYSGRQTSLKADGVELDRDYRQAEKWSSRSSHGYSKHDDYARHDKDADGKERDYLRVSSRSSRDSRGGTHYDRGRRESDYTRSRDHMKDPDRYSRDKYESSGNRSRVDSLAGRTGSGGRYEYSEESEREKHTRDRGGQYDRRDYRRSSGDHKNDRLASYEDSRSYRNNSDSRRDEVKPHRIEQKELTGQRLNKEEKKHNSSETNWDKERYGKESRGDFDDRHVSAFSNECAGKKPKLSGFDKDNYDKEVSKFTSEADEKLSSSSNQAKDGKIIMGQGLSSGNEAASDFDAAKVAAMKAAELVNRNLVGVGVMSADEKKKLLWGNKKTAASEESGHRWDTALFTDRERQEKFNKLMGVKGDGNLEQKPVNQDGGDLKRAEKQKELQMDLEKQYTAGLRRRDGRTVGLGL